MARRTEQVTVEPREAETPQEVTIDRDQMAREQIRDRAFEDRDLRRVVAQTPQADYAEVAARRRLVQEDEAGFEGGERAEQETAGVKGLNSKSQSTQGLEWTGKNIDEMIDFCGLDPLGGKAATFSHEWTGAAQLHVYDRATGESDEESLGRTLQVPLGATVVRQGERRDGGWDRLFVADDRQLSRRFDAADAA
jgi:hypothetical protein